MADPDRRSSGAGGEPPLTLGARRQARSRGPTPISLIVSLLILAAVIGAVAWLYRSGARGPGAAPQPVGAALGDVRVAAPPQSQAPDAAAGLSIYKDQPSAPANPAFAPPPEAPAPRPAEAHAGAAQPDQTRAEPPAAPEATTPPAAAGAARGDALSALIDRSTRDAPPRSPKLAKASAPPVASTPAAAGPTDVQIGAFSSAAQADAAWSAAAAAAPGAMAGHGKRVAPLTRDGATLYRAFITGFASRDDAKALCDRLRAAGRSCFLR
jgi:hypothetical protein